MSKRGQSKTRHLPFSQLLPFLDSLTTSSHELDHIHNVPSTVILSTRESKLTQQLPYIHITPEWTSMKIQYLCCATRATGKVLNTIGALSSYNSVL